MKKFKKNLEKQISVEVQFWKDVFTRLLKIILCLTAGNCTLWGNELEKILIQKDIFFAKLNFLLNMILYWID